MSTGTGLEPLRAPGLLLYPKIFARVQSRSKLTPHHKNPAAVCRGVIFPQGALPPMWREFSPLRSKNSLFSPTEERRQMPFGLPAGNGFPLLLLLRKKDTLGSPARPKTSSQRLAVANSLLRVRASTKNFVGIPFAACCLQTESRR